MRKIKNTFFFFTFGLEETWHKTKEVSRYLTGFLKLIIKMLVVFTEFFDIKKIQTN
jgi:hypothetical protein